MKSYRTSIIVFRAFYCAYKNHNMNLLIEAGFPGFERVAAALRYTAAI